MYRNFLYHKSLLVRGPLGTFVKMTYLTLFEPCSKLTMFLTCGVKNIYKILTLSYFSIQLNCMSYNI